MEEPAQKTEKNQPEWEKESQERVVWQRQTVPKRKHYAAEVPAWRTAEMPSSTWGWGLEARRMDAVGREITRHLGRLLPIVRQPSGSLTRNQAGSGVHPVLSIYQTERDQRSAKEWWASAGEELNWGGRRKDWWPRELSNTEKWRQGDQVMNRKSWGVIKTFPHQ